MAKIITIGDLRGGRNGADPPLSLPDNQCVEAVNIDHFDGTLGRKRGGATAVSQTGGTAFSSGIQALFRHIPGAVETAAELWAVDGAATPIVKRLAGSPTWANVTMADSISTAPQSVEFASFNGKLFLAYDSPVDYLHVYDPTLGTPIVRRSGFNTPAAPTAANTGAGAYAAVLRYYRVRWLQLNGTTVVRRSEPSASVSFTPSGTGTAARVTQPAAAGEQETHWEIEAGTDNSTFYRLSQTAIATTTYDDSAVTTSYATTGTLSVTTGEQTKWTSVRYLLTDGNRLLGAGSWESGGKNSRIWFSPVLGSTGAGDDERVIATTDVENWIDLNENDGGTITGLGGPVYGTIYAFKYRQIWKIPPTGNLTTPYLPRKIADHSYGCIASKSIIVGKDNAGNPALYFLSPNGPCRIIVYPGGSAAPQYLGRDIEDIWADINLAASTVVAHGVYHSDKHQVWWWIATGSSNDPDTKLVFDVLLGTFVQGDRVRGGWYEHTGATAAARCSTMMSNTLGATMSRDLKPYIGRASGTLIWKTDTTDLDDAGTTFQAYVKTKPLPVAPLGQNVQVGQSILLAKAASGVTITQTLDRDFGVETRTSTALLTADASETRVIKKFEASDLAQAGTVQVQLGDASAVANNWVLDALSIPIIGQEQR